MRGSASLDLETGESFRPRTVAAGTSSGTTPEPVGIQPDAQQLRVDVGAFEFAGDVAQVMGGARDAVAQGGGAARVAGARQQAFQEIAEGVQAVHHFVAVRMARKEIRPGAQRGFEHALVGIGEARLPVASKRSHQAIADFNW